MKIVNFGGGNSYTLFIRNGREMCVWLWEGTRNVEVYSPKHLVQNLVKTWARWTSFGLVRKRGNYKKYFQMNVVAYRTSDCEWDCVYQQTWDCLGRKIFLYLTISFSEARRHFFIVLTFSITVVGMLAKKILSYRSI